MVDLELLGEGEVEALAEAGALDGAGQRLADGHLVAGDLGVAVVGPGGARGHADAEGGQVVEEEGIQVVGVEDDEHIGLHGVEMLGHGAVELGGLAAGVLLDLGGRHRRMGHPEACHDLGHRAPPSSESGGV